MTLTLNLTLTLMLTQAHLPMVAEHVDPDDRLAERRVRALHKVVVDVLLVFHRIEALHMCMGLNISPGFETCFKSAQPEADNENTAHLQAHWFMSL